MRRSKHGKEPHEPKAEAPNGAERCPVEGAEGRQGGIPAALEDWEAKELTRAYNVARKRLQRCREANGTNPVKGKREAE